MNKAEVDRETEVAKALVKAGRCDEARYKFNCILRDCRHEFVLADRKPRFVIDECGVCGVARVNGVIEI